MAKRLVARLTMAVIASLWLMPMAHGQTAASPMQDTVGDDVAASRIPTNAVDTKSLPSPSQNLPSAAISGVAAQVVTEKIVTALSVTVQKKSRSVVVNARPKIGLVLSGGGARGLAHIGVLRELEKRHIPIDYIAGTSAGALIGGMYAGGMSVDEIEQRVKSIDFDKLLFASNDRREKTQYVRELEYKGNEFVDLSITRTGAVVLPRAVINDARVEETLRDIFQRYPTTIDFDRLPIPFRAVATDLTTGEKVVLKKGVLAQALRASMSIPAVFAPVDVDGRLLTDGMVASNLPIDTVREMGAQKIIAVDVGEKLLTKDKINSVFGVSEQLLNILVDRNVKEEVKTLSSQDTYILVDVGDVTSLQFNRLTEAVKYGKSAIDNPTVEQKLAAYALPATQYDAVMAHHRESKPASMPFITFVRVQTNGLANPEFLRQKVLARENHSLDMAQVNADIRNLLNVDRIDSVRFEVESVGNQNELVYHVHEKGAANNVVSAGLSIEGNSMSDQRTALHLTHRNVWINHQGAEWRNDLTLGNLGEFTTELNQPFTLQQEWFVRPQLGFQFGKNAVYLPNQYTEAAHYNINRQDARILFGQNFGTVGEWGMGFGWHRAEVQANTTNPALPIEGSKSKRFTLEGEMTIDRLDNYILPTQGQFYRLYARFAPTADAGYSPHYFQSGFKGIWAHRLTEQNALVTQLELAGQNNTDNVYLSPFHLGGFQHLSGYEPNQFVGNYLAYGNVSYRYISPWKLLNNPLIFGMSVEAGNTWSSLTEISRQNLKASGALFGAINTPIGPAQLGLGITRTGHANLYFYLGHTFSEW